MIQHTRQPQAPGTSPAPGVVTRKAVEPAPPGRQGAAVRAGAGVPLAPADVLHLQRSVGNRATSALLGASRPSGGPAAPVQRMQFTRFQGFSRLLNWSYSSDEEALLALEKRVGEAVAGLREYVENDQYGVEAPPGLTELEAEYAQIQASVLAGGDYAATGKRLQGLLTRADRLSSSLARYDVPLSESYDISQQEGLPQSYRVAPDTPLVEVVDKAVALAGREDLSDAGELREVLDVLGQWVSDALIKFSGSMLAPAAVSVKAEVLEAATAVQTAYLLATVNKDLPAATTQYLKATSILSGTSFASALLGLLSEQTKGRAYPKYREASEKPYDTGAIMLAGALVHDGFAPDVVVGLPTGGVHAATRVAAALTIITGKTPVLWATRPQGVKADSKAFMEGTTDEDAFSMDERRHLMGRVPSGALKVLVVDDGFVSGGTMTIARRMYTEMLGRYAAVEVRTGVIESSWTQMDTQVQTENGVTANPADYVVTPGLGVAGRTGALHTAANNDPGAANLRTPTGPKSSVGLVGSAGQLKVLTVADVLQGA